jgi:hypothetical protein
MSGDCRRPLELATLVDYWFEDAAPPEQERVEEHLMECEGCSGRLRALVALGEGVRRAAHQGRVHVVVTPAYLETAAREGLRTREYRVSPGGSVVCTVTPEDDLLITRLTVDLTGVSRLDLVTMWEGRHDERLLDVPVSPDARELLVAQPMPAIRALGPTVLRMRLLAQEEGGERLLGEYTFAHTPTRG